MPTRNERDLSAYLKRIEQRLRIAERQGGSSAQDVTILEGGGGTGGDLSAHMHYQRFVITTLPTASVILTYVPTSRGVWLDQNGLAADESVDFTVNYATGLVTLLPPMRNYLRVGDVVSARYLTVTVDGSPVLTDGTNADTDFGDTFARPDALALDVASGGRVWAEPDGWGIEGLAAYTPTAGDTSAARLEYGADDQDVQVTISATPDSTDAVAWLLFRVSEDGSSAYGVRCDLATGGMGVYALQGTLWDSGAYGDGNYGEVLASTLIQSIAGTPGPTGSDTVVRARILLDQITVWSGGTQVADFADSTFDAGTYAGLATSGAGRTKVRFRNLEQGA